MVLESLVPRTESEEVRRLKADNLRLARELKLVRVEVRAYKREFEDSRKKVAESSNSMGNSDLMQEIAHMVSNFVDGCLAALQLPAALLAGDSRPLARATRAAI
ncbi:unnamed protein product [Euphydryas editha]|uniref:Uncharacterized protein n=1 Tax=Euphydryas editha TaxID=104508 RepID=A0AAU9UUP4_EUPED|nr:unnamed protein product [Euphydryas editha]